MKKIINLTAIFLTLIMTLGVLCSCGDTEEPSDDGGLNGPGGVQDQITQGYEIGQRCPTMSLELVDSDSTVNPKDYRGKVVVLNFWGIWCGPCKSELPHFDRVAEEYSDEVVIIAIHSVRDKAYAPDYIGENFQGSNIIFAYDKSISSGPDMYYDLTGGAGYYPKTLILDKEGIVTYSVEGDISYETLKYEVDAALDLGK